MKYLLDTNICIHFLKGEFGLDAKIEAVGLQSCFISELNLAEIEFGVENGSETYREQNRASLEKLIALFKGRIIPIRPCFSIYAKEKARLRKAGTPIGEFDLLIGCSALANNMIAVTRNTREMNQISELEVENWIG